MLASDSDPLAVQIAADNARMNGVGPLVRGSLKARGFAHPSLRCRKADLVLANLLELALYDLAPSLSLKASRPGGRAILSGLTETQARGIAAR